MLYFNSNLVATLYYRWRNKYRGLRMDQAKRLK